MSADAILVANRFLDLARAEGVTLDTVKLQKLVLLAHGFCWGVAGKPLLSDRIEARNWGPIIPALHGMIKQYGSGEVTAQQLEGATGSLEEPEGSAVIHAVWANFGHNSGQELAAVVTAKGSPWDLAHKEGCTVISEERIRNYYHRLVTESGSGPADVEL